MRSGRRVAVVPAPLGQRRALVEAEQRVGRLDLHLARAARGDGSSSTTMAMFCIASRKRRGIERERVSDEAFERVARHVRPRRLSPRLRAGFRRVASRARATVGSSRSRRARRTDRRAASACRCGGRAGSACRTCASSAPAAARAQLLLDDLRDRRDFGDADAIGDAQHVPIDRQSRARRARGRARRSRSCGRRRAARRARPCRPAPRRRARATSACAMPMSDFDFGAEEAGRVNLRLELRRRRPSPARARRDSA